jgi:molybdopterin synthase sulfur carrier subunit
MDERGSVRRHVNVFVNGENIRFLDGLRTPARDGATIMIIAAVSGG